MESIKEKLTRWFDCLLEVVVVAIVAGVVFTVISKLMSLLFN